MSKYLVLIALLFSTGLAYGDMCVSPEKEACATQFTDGASVYGCNYLRDQCQSSGPCKTPDVTPCCKIADDNARLDCKEMYGASPVLYDECIKGVHWAADPVRCKDNK